MRHARVSESVLSAAVAACEWGVSTLCALLLYHGRAGAWPSIPTLARTVGKSPDRVRRALHEFVEAGILLASQRKRPDGSCTSTCYTLAARFQVGDFEADTPSRRHNPPLACTQGGSEQSKEQSIPLSPPAAVQVTAGGSANPPATPPIPATTPAGDRAARRLVFAAWLVLYRAKLRRPYLPHPRTDNRAIGLLVGMAIADGAEDVEAVGAWGRSYLAAYLERATGRAVERRFPLRYAPALDWLCLGGAPSRPRYHEPAPIVGRGCTAADAVAGNPELRARAAALGLRFERAG